MKVQIYLGPASVSDAMMCVKSGSDLIGFAADKKLLNDTEYTGGNLPSFSDIGSIFSCLPKSIEKVALTFETEIMPIVEMVNIVKPSIVHLAGKEKILPERIAELKKTIPSVKIMQAVAVNQPEPIAFALKYSSVCDYFLLDSDGDVEVHPYGVGATGSTHDWTVSAEIVRKVNVPTILAGGLSPANVKEAIKVVNPWGVDSFTLTNVHPLHNSFKDEIKVKQFINSAKNSEKTELCDVVHE